MAISCHLSFGECPIGTLIVESVEITPQLSLFDENMYFQRHIICGFIIQPVKVFLIYLLNST